MRDHAVVINKTVSFPPLTPEEKVLPDTHAGNEPEFLIDTGDTTVQCIAG